MLNPIGIIRRCQQNFIHSKMDAYGIPPLDGLTLRMLLFLKQCNQDTLCCHLEIDKSRVARSMARLEEQGYVRRDVNSSNKREKLIELTEEGLLMARKVDAVFEEWNAVCFHGFTQQERAEYTTYLERIARNAASNRREERQHG